MAQIDVADVDIELKNVTKEFPSPASGTTVRAVDDISLEIYNGEFFALLGPSGCGKTTTLRMIAGFDDPTVGEILLRGKAVQNIPPFHRPVNTVFQDYALFPHMTVLQNVLFGLQMRGVNRKEAKQHAHEALEMVRLPNIADRKPRQLSGGQQQRVALARALVNKPAVLLLDEPLGALDLKLRKAMQFELASMQHELGITFIYVTHDQEEALTMADRIAVLDQGKILQVGTPSEIYEAPTTRFVADFIGETNFVEGWYLGMEGPFARVRLDDDTVINATCGVDSLSENQQVTVALRPEKITLTLGDSDSSNGSAAEGTFRVAAQEMLRSLEHQHSANHVPATVLTANYIGTDTRYVVKIGQSSQLIVRMQNFGHRYDTNFKDGQQVDVFWAAENARILTE